jgi:hypothetical protein
LLNDLATLGVRRGTSEANALLRGFASANAHRQVAIQHRLAIQRQTTTHQALVLHVTEILQQRHSSLITANAIDFYAVLLILNSDVALRNQQQIVD